MSAEMSVEWDGRQDATERLIKEMYAAVGMPGPVPADGEDEPRTVGAAVARLDGALLGWAWTFEDRDHGRVAARVQGLYMPREMHRLETGFYELIPPAAEEFQMISRLYRRAAEAARAAGFHTLRWNDRDTGPGGRAAIALNAHGHSTDARFWSVEPAMWQAPVGLPDVQVHPQPGPALTLTTADAEVFAVIDRHAAYVNAGEAIVYRSAEPHELAALIAELVRRLRRDHPEVTELTVYEFDGAVVSEALALAGLRITARSMDYELSLTSSRAQQ
ncbi:hypothetical protein P8605_35315 [Streptomyces sp. T-3]|nr:hypothetical protein [Streptomyces sp. T-3]